MGSSQPAALHWSAKREHICRVYIIARCSGDGNIVRSRFRPRQTGSARLSITPDDDWSTIEVCNGVGASLSLARNEYSTLSTACLCGYTGYNGAPIVLIEPIKCGNEFFE